jgi:class 3 adenylate cyclase
MTRIGYYVTRIQADVMHRRDDLLAAYEMSPDTSRYWAVLDLVSSSNYRLTRGAKEGYVRGEEFYALVYAAIAPYGEIQPLKELGDGVLLASSEIRPLFEACVLVGQVAVELADVSGSDAFPFAVRAAIGYGPCKRLRDRVSADYLGSPIDAVARLTGVATKNDLVISEDAFKPNRQTLEDYDDFAKFTELKQLSSEQSKNMVTPVQYRQVIIDRPALNRHEGGFAPWKKLTGSAVRDE